MSYVVMLSLKMADFLNQ